MESPAGAPRSASRLFAVYAIASFFPVLVLGVVLAITYRQDANARGLSEGRSEAALLARTAVEPLLTNPSLSNGLNRSEHAALRQMSAGAVASGYVLQLRLRDLSGRIVFASDGDTSAAAEDDEALDAAHGEVVSKITHLFADNNPDGSSQGVKAAEVYRPLYDGAGQVGVLEVYLPYAPIARDVTAGLSGLYRDLGVGLGVLYLLLALISYSATKPLRAQVARNAFLAEHDLLTGLANRALFHRRVTEAVSRADRDNVVVAVIDLDRFKDVNDTLGHANGDCLLAEIGKRLVDALGDDDVVARLGGDEFGLVLAHVGSVEEARNRLLHVRRLLHRDVEVSGLPLAVDASIGFAMAPHDGDTFEVLLQHADVAMYVAKNTHAGVTRYDGTQDHYDSAKLALVAELKRAIAGDELVLHFQPKASVATKEIVAVEALVRWNHPERGLLYPDAFLPIAEQTGIIDSLTAWVMRTALEQLVNWGPVLEDVSVAVNISARNLSREDFADTVLAAVRASNVRPERVLVEMTETALVADPERAGRSLRRLAAAGIRVSLDDFGQGQTSLGYLSTLPLHEVKIDKSFVLDMLEDRSHAAIVRSVIELAHNLGFEVVAEGVETEPILHELELLGCDIAQGFLLARPMPAGQLPGWVLTHRRDRGVHGTPSPASVLT
jgi:diguanylate cyclase (GGDEF)-like protein